MRRYAVNYAAIANIVVSPDLPATEPAAEKPLDARWKTIDVKRALDEPGRRWRRRFRFLQA